jgi:hypothetical protein
MDVQPPIQLPKVESQQVPEDLLQRLHDANQHFHAAKENLTKEMDKPEYRHEERVDRAGNEIREAEREVEEITAKISDALESPSKKQGDDPAAGNAEQ